MQQRFGKVSQKAIVERALKFAKKNFCSVSKSAKFAKVFSYTVYFLEWLSRLLLENGSVGCVAGDRGHLEREGGEWDPVVYHFIPLLEIIIIWRERGSCYIGPIQERSDHDVIMSHTIFFSQRC